jgi:hypothetical protein
MEETIGRLVEDLNKKDEVLEKAKNMIDILREELIKSKEDNRKMKEN